MNVLLYTEEHLEALKVAAHEDQHAVLQPRFILEDKGDIVGYIGHIPMINVWLHTKKVKAATSYRVLQNIEEYLNASGVKLYALPVPDCSPVYPYLERLNFISTDAKVYLKKV